MTTITINNCVYKIHPIYNLYAGSKDGSIIHILKRVPFKGNKHPSGYLICMVRKFSQSGQKSYRSHRFIYECFNGVIPGGKQVDHFNDVKDDNRLCNLQVLTPSQNSKKSAKNRDYSFVVNNHKNRKSVKATNKKTNEVSYYFSMYAASQHLNISVSIIKMVCDKKYGYKTGKSKKDGHSYTFEYIKEELPDNHIKSKNIRRKKVSEEEKRKHRLDWWNKEYKCGKCGTVTKNNSEYRHNKKCHSQQ